MAASENGKVILTGLDGIAGIEITNLNSQGTKLYGSFPKFSVKIGNQSTEGGDFELDTLADTMEWTAHLPIPFEFCDAGGDAYIEVIVQFKTSTRAPIVVGGGFALPTICIGGDSVIISNPSGSYYHPTKTIEIGKPDAPVTIEVEKFKGRGITGYTKIVDGQLDSLILGAINLQIPIANTGGYFQDIQAGAQGITESDQTYSGSFLVSYGAQKLPSPIDNYVADGSVEGSYNTDGTFYLRGSVKVIGIEMGYGQIDYSPQAGIKIEAHNYAAFGPFAFNYVKFAAGSGTYSGEAGGNYGIPPRLLFGLNPGFISLGNFGAQFFVNNCVVDLGVYASICFPPCIPPVRICVPCPRSNWRVSCRRKWTGWRNSCLRVSCWSHGSFWVENVCTTTPALGMKHNFKLGVKFPRCGGNVDFYLNANDNIPTFAEMMLHPDRVAYLRNLEPWEKPYFTFEQQPTGGFLTFMDNYDVKHKAYFDLGQTLIPPSSGNNGFTPLGNDQPGDENYTYTFDIEEGASDLLIRICWENEVTDPFPVPMSVDSINGTSTIFNWTDTPVGLNDYPGFRGFTGQSLEEKNTIYAFIDPLAGKYTIELPKDQALGRTSIEVLSENEKVQVAYLEAEDAGGRDGEVLPGTFDLFFDALDPEGDLENTTVTIYLDSNLTGYDGTQVFESTLSDLEIGEPIRFLTDNLPLQPGYYYPYIAVSDLKSEPTFFYGSNRVFVQKDAAPDPVEGIKYAPGDGGVYLSWDEFARFDNIATSEEAAKIIPVKYYRMVASESYDFDRFDHSQVVWPGISHGFLSGLENGKPYFVSVVAVGEDEALTHSFPKEIFRVYPRRTSPGSPPVITSQPSGIEITSGQEWFYNPQAVDGDSLDPEYVLIKKSHDNESDPSNWNNFNNAWKWSLIQAPENMVINERTGNILWKPLNDQVGTHLVRILVEEDNNRIDDRSLEFGSFTAYQDIELTVKPADGWSIVTPEATGYHFASIPPHSAFPGENYIYKPVHNVDLTQLNNVEYRLLQGPESMTVDSKSGSLEWNVPLSSAGEIVTIEVIVDGVHSATQGWFVNIISPDRIFPRPITIERILNNERGLVFTFNRNLTHKVYKLMWSSDLADNFQVLKFSLDEDTVTNPNDLVLVDFSIGPDENVDQPTLTMAVGSDIIPPSARFFKIQAE